MGLSFPALESIGQITGGTAGPSTSGAARSGGGSAGGIGPLVIGGFKSDGSASAMASVPWWVWAAGIGALAFIAWRVLR